MLHIEREILELANQAGPNGPTLPAPLCISDAVDRLLKRKHLVVADPGTGQIAITDEGRAALTS